MMQKSDASDLMAGGTFGGAAWHKDPDHVVLKRLLD
jgi:hypothetical protein